MLYYKFVYRYSVPYLILYYLLYFIIIFVECMFLVVKSGYKVIGVIAKLMLRIKRSKLKLR